MQEFVPYLILINAFTLFLMHSDKKRAQKHRWRIPEAVLIFVCLLGGSPGGILGMLFFRHKTRKPLFCIGIPVIAILQTCLTIWFT